MLKDGVWRSSTHQCGPSCTTKCPTHACWFPAQSQHFYCFSVICSLHHSALSIIFSSQLTQVVWWPHEAQHVEVRARNHSAGQRAFSLGTLAVLLCPWDGALSQLNQNIRHPCAVCILHSIAADGFITYKCIQGLLLCSVANPISHCFNSLSWPCFLIPLECRSALLCFFCACFLISHPLSPSQLPLSQCNPFVSESLALISDFPSTSSPPTLIFLISPPTISPPSLGELLFSPSQHTRAPCSAPNLSQLLSISLVLAHCCQVVPSQISFTDFLPVLTMHPLGEPVSLILCVLPASTDFFKVITPGVWHS